MEKKIVTIQFTEYELEVLIRVLESSINRDVIDEFPPQTSEIYLKKYLESALKELKNNNIEPDHTGRT